MAPEADPATDQALSTSEILEMVLFQLDIRTLLTAAQQVCKDWRGLIKRSAKLQRALLFTPSDKCGSDGQHEPVDNPLLREKFPSFFPDQNKRAPNIAYTTLEMTQSPENTKIYVRKEASWRQMLVQQPPVVNFGSICTTHSMGGSTTRRWRISFDDEQDGKVYVKNRGLRMGDLFDYILLNDMIRFEQFSENRIRWASESPLETPYMTSPVEPSRDLMKKFEVYLEEDKVFQCSGGFGDTAEDEKLREQLLDASEAAGLETKPRGSRIPVGDAISYD